MLRILHLEDSPLDAELIMAALAEGGLRCEAVRVETSVEFQGALARESFDLILADYSLPSFDGAAALEIARAQCPDVPFLFVSGAIGEERAIETLRGGATDYVLKQRLERLVPAVRRAWQEARERAERLRLEAERVQAQVENARLQAALEQERKVVQTLANRVLGKPPRIPGLRIASLYRTAHKTERVGGDYFDFLSLAPQGPEGSVRLGVVVGDVCGKGLTAALHTASTRYLLRAYALEDPGPARVLQRLNDALCSEMAAEDEPMFVTLVYGVLDVESGRFVYACAGHPPPVLYHPAACASECLRPTGSVVGAFPDLRYQERCVTLEPGATLALFTDGVTEAGRCRDGDAWGSIRALLERHAADSPERTAQAIFDYAQDLAGGELQDDIAIVVLRRDA